MTPSRRDGHTRPAPVESIGAVLTRLRLASGKSQLRVAELVCAVSGTPTVTRHEISRWERAERIPSRQWLRWLAVVFEVPVDELEQAAAVARDHRDSTPDITDNPPAVARIQPAVRGPQPADPVPAPPARPAAYGPDLADRISALRRMDDLVGGADLVRRVHRELGEAIRLLRHGRGTDRQRRQWLTAVAELAQLAAWVAADAATPATAAGRARAYRIGLRAATEAGQYALAGHLLAAAAHLGTPCHVGTPYRPGAALILARQAYSLARPSASATTRALLAHRIAFAAARAGERRTCEQALADADRAYDRRDPDRDPPWVYWFHDAEVTAATGRCYAALGRPRLAEPLLARALADGRIRLRAWAVYAAWLARARLDLGDVPGACDVAGQALLTTVRVGSVRAWGQLAALHPGLLRLTSVPAVRGYTELLRAARPYLPDGTGVAGRSRAGYG